VLAGDMNEYTQTRAVFAPLAGLLHDADDVAAVPPAERYTYVFDQNSQEIDHVFVSPAVAARGVQLAHVHVNTWAPSLAARASDHDPTAALVRVCNNLQAFRGARPFLFSPARGRGMADIAAQSAGSPRPR
jgi:predicted extracellular nuclease